MLTKQPSFDISFAVVAFDNCFFTSVQVPQAFFYRAYILRAAKRTVKRLDQADFGMFLVLFDTHYLFKLGTVTVCALQLELRGYDVPKQSAEWLELRVLTAHRALLLTSTSRNVLDPVRTDLAHNGYFAPITALWSDCIALTNQAMEFFRSITIFIDCFVHKSVNLVSRMGESLIKLFLILLSLFIVLSKRLSQFFRATWIMSGRLVAFLVLIPHQAQL